MGNTHTSLEVLELLRVLEVLRALSLRTLRALLGAETADNFLHCQYLRHNSEYFKYFKGCEHLGGKYAACAL